MYSTLYTTVHTSDLREGGNKKRKEGKQNNWSYSVAGEEGKREYTQDLKISELCTSSIWKVID